jgi:hypothetical protein
MKKNIVLAVGLLLGLTTSAQENKPDTMRLNLGETEVLIIKTAKGTVIIDSDDETELNDTVDASNGVKDDDERNYSNDGRWSGIDFGTTMLMNPSFQASFPNDKQWENDPAKSFLWNWNITDYRFNLYKEHIGITTGLGLQFMQVGFRNNYLLNENADSIWVVSDTVNNYTKNKLRATYLQIPLLLEFNTNSDEDKSFHVQAGIVGGVRIGSNIKRKIENEGFEAKEKRKGTYGLSPFKMDATVRVGYGSWGAFANYAFLPMFDTAKTSEAYPLSFGLSYSFD